MYTLKPSPEFSKAYTTIVQKDNILAKKIQKAVHLLSQDPKYPSLKSHKVSTAKFGERWSSYVTGDVRIIWDYDEEETLVILLLTIGGHSGRKKVYR